MSIDNNRLLRKQLEQQAKLFTASQDNNELIVSILSTCSVLLRVAEQSMSKTPSQSEIDSYFAGYLGITAKIDGFYKRNSSFLDSNKSVKMQTLLASLRNAEDILEELEKKYEEAEKKNRAINNDIIATKSLLKAEEDNYNYLVGEDKRLKDKLSEVKQRITSLKDDLEKVSSDIESIEPNIEKLIQEVKIARETYEEMIAYYSEFKRIQDGIKEDGYVNMESFNERIHSLNDSGEALMREYDSLLKKLTSDIEALQDKIEKRRKKSS